MQPSSSRSQSGRVRLVHRSQFRSGIVDRPEKRQPREHLWTVPGAQHHIAFELGLASPCRIKLHLDYCKPQVQNCNNTLANLPKQMLRPPIVLLCSFAGAALVGLWLLRHESVRANVLDPSGTFWYFVPLMVPMIAFMLERVEHARKANFFQHGIDFLVFSLAVGRVVGDVPYISGHTLLLSYALISSRSKIVRISALIVLAQTLYLKYFVWHDFVTSNVGVVLGGALALLVSLLPKPKRLERLIQEDRPSSTMP